MQMSPMLCRRADPGNAVSALGKIGLLVRPNDRFGIWRDDSVDFGTVETLEHWPVDTVQ